MRVVENNATIVCEISQARTKKKTTTAVRPNHEIECETVGRRYRRSTDVNTEWVVLSKPAEAPFKNGGGEAVSAERTAERVLIAVGVLETPFRTFGLRGTRGMGKEG